MKNNTFKKLIGKKSTGVIITIIAFVIVFGAIFTVSNLTLASDSLPGIVDIRNDMTSEAYKVLEIVPDVEVSEFGFLVGGEEPLDVSTLYNSTTGEWISWQEYLTQNVETMDETARRNYLMGLVANNSAYISNGVSTSTPMWYETYTEFNVTADTADGVLLGGNAPVYGWMESITSGGEGWNAKFTKVEGKTYDELMAETTPYYIVDTILADSQVPLTEAAITGGTYPDYYYTYKLDASGLFYVPSVTVGELKADILDGGLVDSGEGEDLAENYFILKMKMLTAGDYTATSGPTVYSASDIIYLETGAPYKIDNQTTKGHSLTMPAVTVYYQGGLFSNELFKRYSLDIDESETAQYNVDVQTVTAGVLNAMTRDELTAYLATVDFIYLNAGNATYKYRYNNSAYDLDNDAVELIFEKVCNEKTPCIVDYYLKDLGTSIDTDISNTKAYALACMLMHKNYRNLLVSGQFNPSRIDSELVTWISNIPSTNSHNFVNGNVMVINSAVNKLTDNYHTTFYNASVVSAAYQAVADEIEVENLYRAADQTAGYSQLDPNIYKGTVVRYIMNYVSARAITKKTSIEVLEIQPANVKEPGNSSTENTRGDIDITPSTIRTWLGIKDSSVEVNITTMNTIEFIGTIEDLNSTYDLIYIGADIAGLPRTGNSPSTYKTDFYGTDMDGLIYTNVGGLTSVSANFAGHLETDWKTKYTKVYSTVLARYNGNDITADKYNELVDYVKGTYPIVVSDKLCANNTTPTNSTVDNCTYLYSFLEQHLKDPNVFKVSEVSNGKNNNFKFYANRAKLDIGEKTITGLETTVVGSTPFVQPGAYATGNDQTFKHVTFVSKESDGKAYLRYKFTVTNNGAVYDNTKYTATLYLDSNSDGKFSTEYEKIADTVLTHVASGKIVNNGELVAGEQYTLSRQVPDNFSGLLTWKVEVSQTSNQYIRDSIVGYTRLTDTPKATIKVLQVRRDGGEPLILADAIGNSKGNGNNATLNALVWGGKIGNVNYPGISNDYEFKFTTLTNAEFNTKYANKTLNLMNYDMLVLGFYDSYDIRWGAESDINEQAVKGAGGIREFIDSGKSVLFAHDTTSVTIVPDYKQVTVDGKSGNLYNSYVGANVWGYYLNMYIRDMVGLDTYGISLTTKDGINYSKVKSGEDLSTTPEGQLLMGKLKNTLDSNGYYKIGLKPLAYKPNSGKANTVPQTQGFLYGWMDIYWKSDDHIYRRTNSSYNTYSADKVNEGAVTTYPYYLGETIEIARTHHQYFTLDLNTDADKDGETDLVVWFTMGGNYNTTSNKDVMNSYYIYNKGNITYTGFGDFDTADSRKAATKLDECKLFVNTLVAAYNAAEKTPNVIVYDSDDTLNPTNTFYEYGDIDNNVAFRQDSQRMYFQVSDMNVIRGEKTSFAEYYVALKPGTVSANATTYTTNGVTYQVIKDPTADPHDTSPQQFIKLKNLSTYTTTGQSVDAGQLQCGVVYYVDIPTTVFDIPGVDGQNVNTFMVSANTTLKKIGSLSGEVVSVKTTRPTYNKVDFVHVELFPLD